MSAYFVDKLTIDLIVSALREFNVDYPAIGRQARVDPDGAGKALWRENARSLICRYSPEDAGAYDYDAGAYDAEIGAYAFRELFFIKPGPCAKVLACYEYQSCEHPEWEASDAREACRALADKLLTKLPGYADAPWGLDDDDELGRVCEPGAVSLVPPAAKRKAKR